MSGFDSALPWSPLLVRTQERTAAPFWIVAAAVLSAAFGLIEHSLTVSREEAYGTTVEQLEVAAEGGQRTNQIGFSLVALLGLSYAVLPGAYRWSIRFPWGYLLLGYLLWSGLSVVWSVEPSYTVRRLGILVFCTVGACGVARQCSPRDLCKLTLLALAAQVALGLLVELALGTFRPWTAEYRFSGTLHPNAQGGQCAWLCLSSLLLAVERKRHRLVLLSIFLIGFALLVLTKSRTSCLALFAGLATVWMLRRPMRINLAVALFGAFLLAGLLLVLFVCQIGEDRIAGVLLLGRGEHVGNLNGRTELWQELWDYVLARPLTGYGYRGFWTPEHILAVSEDLYWGMSSAHSLYLESVLSVGIVGTAMLLAAAAGAIGIAARRLHQTGETGIAFLLAILVYAALDGLMEASFVAPSLLTMIAGCGLVQLVWCQSVKTPAVVAWSPDETPAGEGLGR